MVAHSRTERTGGRPEREVQTWLKEYESDGSDKATDQRRREKGTNLLVVGDGEVEAVLQGHESREQSQDASRTRRRRRSDER